MQVSVLLQRSIAELKTVMIDGGRRERAVIWSSIDTSQKKYVQTSTGMRGWAWW